MEPNEDLTEARADSFLSQLIPQVEERMAARYASAHDTAASRERFTTWLALQTEEPGNTATQPSPRTLRNVSAPTKQAASLARWTRAVAASAASGTTWLAATLAGSTHAHLREAWASDLCSLQTEETSARQRVQFATGLVVAAVRLRLDDGVSRALRSVDTLLASPLGSTLATLVPVMVTAVLLAVFKGPLGLASNAVDLMGIAAGSYGAVRALRHYRRSEHKKAPPSRGSRR